MRITTIGAGNHQQLQQNNAQKWAAAGDLGEVKLPKDAVPLFHAGPRGVANIALNTQDARREHIAQLPIEWQQLAAQQLVDCTRGRLFEVIERLTESDPIVLSLAGAVAGVDAQVKEELKRRKAAGK